MLMMVMFGMRLGFCFHTFSSITFPPSMKRRILEAFVMDNKAIIWIGMVVGSTLGGCIPLLWNAGFLSVSSILFSSLGALGGIYLGYKIAG